MRGKKARALRREVYGDSNSPRHRTYEAIKKTEKFLVVDKLGMIRVNKKSIGTLGPLDVAEYTITPVVCVADALRRRYKRLKRLRKHK